MEMTLTTYDAHQVKKIPDSSFSRSVSSPPLSVCSSIRNFKRSQRLHQKKNPIVSSDPLRSALDDCTQYYQNLYHNIAQRPCVERQNDVVFATSIESTSIIDSIKSYPNHKSMGLDGIHILVFKALTDSPFFVEAITDLFHMYAATGLVPSHWSDCNLHLLVKDSKKPATVSNTRPIALSPVIRRIFEKLVLRKWLSQDESWTRLNYGQAGFRRGYSTLSHLVLSDELSRHGSNCSIFLDIKAAFDNVSWPILNNILLERNCPPTALTLILSLICRPASLMLSVNQSERVRISTGKGVFQGGGISAFVFALYIDPMANALNGTIATHFPPALLYADDIQLKPKTIEEGKNLLKICEKYATLLEMKWNLKKCAVVSKNPLSFLLDGQLISRCESYRYLGAVHLHNRVDWAATAVHHTQKQSNFLAVLGNSDWHPRLKLILYRAFVRPINEYVLCLAWLWCQKKLSARQDTLNHLKTAYQNGIKFIFGKSQHTQVLDFISGLGSFDYRLNCLHGGLVASFTRLSSSNPLVKARSVYSISTSSHYLIHNCFNSKYFDMFQASQKSTKTTWKTWKRIKLEELRKIKSAKSPLIAYYAPKSKLPDNSSAIFNLSLSSFRIILNWRINRALNYRNCQCGSTYSRSHISCYLQNNPIYQLVSSSPRFKSQAKYMPPNFNVMDHLLNHNRFDDFLALFSELADLIDL
jgi:hypothetical protein